MKCFALVCSRPEYGSLTFTFLFGSNHFHVPILSSARVLTPFPPAKKTPTGFWPDATPLLEKECDVSRAALIADFDGPFLGHGSRSRTAFAPDDGPVDSGEIELAHRAQQGFERNKLHRSSRGAKMLQPHHIFRIFNRHA